MRLRIGVGIRAGAERLVPVVVAARQSLEPAHMPPRREDKSGDGAHVAEKIQRWVHLTDRQCSSCSDSRVALPPAAVVSIETVRSVAKRCR